MSDELQYESRMSDSDALMWTIEKDPLLRSTITAVSLLDGPVDAERFRDKVDRASRVIPRLRQRVVGNPYSLAPPRWEIDPELRPRLPPADRQRRRCGWRARGARPGAVGRDAGLRPSSTAVGDVPRRRGGRRALGADPEAAPRHHRRRGLDPDRAHPLRPRARPRRSRDPARRARVPRARLGGAPDRRRDLRRPPRRRVRPAIGRNGRRRPARCPRRPGAARPGDSPTP